MVSLIAEALDGRTLARRAAASMLLDVSRNRGAVEASFADNNARVMGADQGKDVAKELRALIVEHGLTSGSKE